jgi:hypothetical protein
LKSDFVRESAGHDVLSVCSALDCRHLSVSRCLYPLCSLENLAEDVTRLKSKMEAPRRAALSPVKRVKVFLCTITLGEGRWPIGWRWQSFLRRLTPTRRCSDADTPNSDEKMRGNGKKRSVLHTITTPIRTSMLSTHERE